MTIQQRPKRQRQAKIWFDERETYAKPPPAKRAKKKAVEVIETKPADEVPPPAVKTLLDAPMVIYDPPCRVPFTPMRQLWPESDPYTLFIRFLGEASICAIVDATNAYATRAFGPLQKNARQWQPLTRGEFLCWLGLLIYMANHIQVRRHKYWSNSDNVVGFFMGKTRWEQIHRFLTFNPDPSAGEVSFFDKL